MCNREWLGIVELSNKMRICHYPGRAIDATLSLDQQNPMETIYKNNWLNADKTIRTISKNSKLTLPPYGSNGYVSSQSSANGGGDKRSSNGHHHRQHGESSTNVSPSSMSSSGSDDEKRRNSISSLGNYQMTLEQMRKLDLEQPSELFQKTFRNLNGYKPSILRQKSEPKYTEWDEVYVENGNERPNAAAVQVKSSSNDRESGSDFTSGAVNNDNAYGYGNHTVRMIPKIKRSQTVRYATPNDTRLSHSNSVNIKNLFNRNESGKIDGQAHYPTATINKNFNRFKRANLLAIQNSFSSTQPAANGEGEDSFSANGNGIQAGRMRAYTNGEIIDQNGRRESKAANGDFNYATMSYDYENQSKPPEASNIKIPGGNKVNGKSLLRARSVRINCTPYEDVIFDQLNAEKRKCDKSSPTAMAIDLSQSHDASKKSILANVQPLPRLTPIIKQKANVIQRNNEQVLPSSPHDQVFTHNGGTWHDQFVAPPAQSLPVQTTQSPSMPPQPAPPPPPTQSLRKTSSSSSLSSAASKNCDCNSNVSDFSIPRPRLIVPVHTYARKRRTGNLIQGSSNNNSNDIDNNNCNDDVVVVQPRNSAIAYQQPANPKNGKIWLDHLSVKSERGEWSLSHFHSNFLFEINIYNSPDSEEVKWPAAVGHKPFNPIKLSYPNTKNWLIIMIENATRDASTGPPPLCDYKIKISKWSFDKFSDQFIFIHFRRRRRRRRSSLILICHDCTKTGPKNEYESRWGTVPSCSRFSMEICLGS